MYFRAHIIPNWSRESNLGITTFNFESNNRSTRVTHDNHEDEDKEGRHDSGQQRYRILSCHFDLLRLRRGSVVEKVEVAVKVRCAGETREEIV